MNLVIAATVLYVFSLLVSVATKSRINKPLFITGGVAIVIAFIAVYAATNVQENKGSVKSAAVISQTFEQIDDFKRNAAQHLLDNTAGYTITGVAHELSLFRVDNTFAVCSDRDEIESAQYLELAQLIEPISKSAPKIMDDIEVTLSQHRGITDCQFRVIESIAQQSKSS